MRAAGEADDSAVAPCVAGRELQRQAGTLRKTQQDDALRRQPCRFQLRHDLADAGDAGGEARLVLWYRCHKAVGIPGESSAWGAR